MIEEGNETDAQFLYTIPLDTKSQNMTVEGNETDAQFMYTIQLDTNRIT